MAEQLREENAAAVFTRSSRSFRARIFQTAIRVAIVIVGVIGFRAFLSPTGIPLGLAVAWLGAWTMPTTRAASETSQPASEIFQADPQV
jgi:hypothetical protein